MDLRAICLKLCAVVAWVATLAATPGCNRGDDPTAGNATVPAGERQIVALGRLEPSGGVLEIGALPGDGLERFADGVTEGARIPAGKELAYLTSYDLRSTQLDAANAKLDLSQRQREQELAVANANFEQALAAKAEVDAKLEELQAQAEGLTTLAEAARIAQADFQSLVELRSTDSELVTDIQFRRKENEAAQAQQEYDVKQRTHAAALKAAEAAVAAAAQNVELAEVNRKLADEVDNTLVAQIERKVAEETLKQSVLSTPAARNGGPTEFTILKIFVEPGEFISQLPVFQIGDLSRMSCIAEVYEADVKEIEVGQQVTIHSPALSKPYVSENGDGGAGLPGKVTHIGSLVSSGGLIQRNPLAPSDRSIVEVIIEIAGDDAAATENAIAEAAGHIGLQVTVKFGDKPGQRSPLVRPIGPTPPTMVTRPRAAPPTTMRPDNRRPGPDGHATMQ
jgi:HlyD family secretion protein